MSAFRINFYIPELMNLRCFNKAKYDPRTSIHFCHSLTKLWIPVLENSKGFDAKKPLDAISTSPLEQNIF